MGNPFGVELPDNFGSSNASTDTGSAPEVTNNEQSFSKEGLNTETTNKSVQDILDLDKLDRFRFQGKEWTAKDLRNAYMMRQDYTRKTQEISETRKYVDNFPADLKSVIENPDLIHDLRAVYPAEFVEIAEKALAMRQGNPGSSQTTSAQGAQNTPPELANVLKDLSSLKSEMSAYKQEKYQAEIAKSEAWLDKTYASLTEKYPFTKRPGATEIVTARAAYAREQGYEINEKVLESFFRDVNKMFKDEQVSRTKAQISGQSNANLRGKDTGAGGGIPGSPAVRPKSMREAKEAALDYFTGRSR